ncbi:MAG: HNH endonuclease [Nitrospinota bacterium]|nr:HNH endonuclease [Nitrospinota bacterium]
MENPSDQQIRREKEKVRRLKKSRWWQSRLNAGICHYCGKKFSRSELTMDHIVPLARGGKSVKGNVAVSCRSCNQDKKYYTPAEVILQDQFNEEIVF